MEVGLRLCLTLDGNATNSVASACAGAGRNGGLVGTVDMGFVLAADCASGTVAGPLNVC